MDALADILATNRIGGSLFLRGHLRSPWSVQFEPTGYIGIYTLTRGICWLQLANDHPPLQLAQGDVVLLPHGSGHVLSDAPNRAPIDSTRLTEDCDLGPGAEIHHGGTGPETIILCGAYEFEPEAAHMVLSSLPPVIHVQATMAESSTGLQTALRLLAIEQAEGRAGYRTVTDRLVDMLFVYILRSWLDTQSEGTAGWLAALRHPQVGRALSLMHRGLEHLWTVGTLAREVGMSRAAFAHDFAELVGEPPLTYLTRLRMDAAARLLRDGDESMAWIAERIGYDSEHSFGKAFKRVRGMSPGRYRNNYADGLMPNDIMAARRTNI